MKAVRWSTSTKESISIRLARGHDPEMIKQSFGTLVDELTVLHTKPEKLLAEIRKLRQELEAAKKGVVNGKTHKA